MKTVLIPFLISCSLMLLSCNSSTYEYWDISHFNIDEEALSDNEKIKLIYTSRAPNYNEDLEYYIQFVVISQESGDTVNVLSIVNNYFGEGDSDKIFSFIHKDNVAYDIMITNVGNTDFSDFKKSNSKNIQKVVRDPEFDFIADNNYPSIIGIVGQTDSDKTIIEY